MTLLGSLIGRLLPPRLLNAHVDLKLMVGELDGVGEPDRVGSLQQQLIRTIDIACTRCFCGYNWPAALRRVKCVRKNHACVARFRILSQGCRCLDTWFGRTSCRLINRG